MGVRSIIEIAVEDSAFKRFYETFSQYSAEIDAQPEAWGKLSEAMGGATESLQGGARASKDALALAAAQATTISNAIKEAAEGTEKLETGAKRSSSAIDKLRKGAEGVAGAVKSIAGGVLRLAEFAGLGGLLGGFGITGLAGAAFNRARAAGQLGLTPGQLASFQVNAQPFLGTSALEAAANAQIDLSKAGQLAVLGIDYRRAQTMDTGDLAFAELRAARKAYLAAQKSGLPPLQSPEVMSYLALGGNLNELRYAAGQSEADLNATQREYHRDRATLGFDKQTAAEWTQLKKQLDRAGTAIETSLIRGLAPLTPQLSELAKAFADLITGALGNKSLRNALDEVAAGIGQLAKFLENVDWVKFGDQIAGVVKFLDWLTGPIVIQKGSVLDKLFGSPQAPFNLTTLPGDIHAIGEVETKFWSGNYETLKAALAGGVQNLGNAWKFLTSPIAGPAAAAVLGVAQQKKVDPLLALATAMNESGLNPRSVGDSGHSVGLFQLNDQGEGAGMGDQRYDPKTNARVALSVLSDKLQLSQSAALNEFSRNVHRQYAIMGKEAPSHAQIAALAGSPGLYAAIAQRPEDPFAYARSVNAIYKSLRDELPNSASQTSLQKTIKKALQKRTQKPATVSIYNATSSRVAISANAAGLG